MKNMKLVQMRLTPRRRTMRIVGPPMKGEERVSKMITSEVGEGPHVMGTMMATLMVLCHLLYVI